MPSPVSPPPGLRWLVRLRWLALVGQAVTVAGAILGMGARVPLEVLGPCMGVTAATNAWVSWRIWSKQSLPAGTAPALVALDVVTLTVMLFWTGGAQSPFAVFYLLHVTIAAILLSPLAAAGCVVLAAAGFAGLFASPYALAEMGGRVAENPTAAQAKGLAVALVVAGGFLAFFAGKLRAELVRREAELAEARMQRVRDERFASLVTLSAGVAHELATPLATIAVAARELESGRCGVCGEAAALDDARLIRAEVERCRGVIEKLSDQATQGSGDEMGVLPLAELRTRLAEFASAEVLRRVEVMVTPPDAAVLVPVEPLLQAVAVLLKNGVEADPRGGRVTLRVECGQAELQCEVRDQGEGMTPEVQARAGEPFFTTKEPGRGMGLGLFLVRMFTERVGGTFAIESLSGRGTIARLVVPLQGGGVA